MDKNDGIMILNVDVDDDVERKRDKNMSEVFTAKVIHFLTFVYIIFHFNKEIFPVK